MRPVSTSNTSNCFDDGCELCAELRGSSSRFSTIYGRHSESRILAKTNNFVVMPSIGMLGDAHLMVVSATHETAASKLSPPLKVELDQIVSALRNWLHGVVGQNVLVFENGDPAANGEMGCTISHLHVHLVATNAPIDKIVADVGALGRLREVAGLTEIPASVAAYSFFDGGDRALVIEQRLPSQTIRRLIASAIGEPRWDWRQVEAEPKLISLMESSRAAVSDVVGCLAFAHSSTHA